MRVIPTKVHGVLDYATAIMLFALPRMAGWDDRMTMILTVAAVGTLIYSLLTRYEMGAFPVLPMEWHLGIDLMSGALFLVLALALGDEPFSVRYTLAAIGAFEVMASLLSRTDPTPAGAGMRGGTRSRGF